MSIDIADVNLPSDWQKIVNRYARPDLKRGVWQIINSFVPYFACWLAMYFSLRVSPWLTLALAFPTAGLLIRIFIILHDCGHGSFFKSSKANDWLGLISGVLTFTPYYQWRHDHALHHASSGDLDRRGVGDVTTLTVREYQALPWWKRLGYRVYRHPIVMFGIGPAYLFLLAHRFMSPYSGRRERWSVHFTNAALAALFTVAGAVLGFKEVFLIQIPLILLTGAIGIWLFYIQHQFEDTYWKEHPEWKYIPSALQGSSYYKLHPVLQWFTGNIGLHHIHHLNPKIPNYNLPKCFKENPFFQQVTIITFWESLTAVSLKLWDEEQQKLIGFRQLKSMRSS